MSASKDHRTGGSGGSRERTRPDLASAETLADEGAAATRLAVSSADAGHLRDPRRAAPADAAVAETQTPRAGSGSEDTPLVAISTGEVKRDAERFGQNPDQKLQLPTGRLRAGWKTATASEVPAPATRYRIDHEVARGGLGRVLLAEDRWLGRNVALKELRSGRQQAEPRFRREALITARLEHPAIVPIHDAGHWPNGEPFYAMKMVSGRSLAAAIKEASTLAERMALLSSVRAVADAIAYAHDHRIIHRDLKPANVMVGDYGETVVIDWGLAKDLDAGEEDGVESSISFAAPTAGEDLTLAGSVLGTPSYMSPEQARGDSVDERTDVYAIGAILYSVLAGAAPYAGSNSAEILSHVLTVAPPAVTTRTPEVAPDLAAIVDKAMARAPEDRYQSAAELAEDLKRFETGQLVSAHRYSLPSLLLRWVVKHRGVVAVAGIAVLLLSGFGVVAIRSIMAKERTAQAERRVAQDQRSVAERQRALAEDRANQVTLLQARSSLATDPTMAVAWLKRVAPEEPYLADIRAIAQRAVTAGVARDVIETGQAVYTTAISADGATIAIPWRDGAILVRDLATGAEKTLAGNGSQLAQLAFSPDGRQLASMTFNGTVTLWTVETGRAVELGHHRGVAHHLVFSPDGRWLASAANEPRVFLWELPSRRQQVLEASSDKVITLAFAPDSGSLATAGGDGTLRLWDPATGRQRSSLKEKSSLRLVAFSPDGALLATGQESGELSVWSLATAKQTRWPGHRQPIEGLVFSPDSRLLASIDRYGGVSVRDLETGGSRSLSGHASGGAGLAFDQAMEWLCSWGDGALQLWDPHTGELEGSLLGHGPRVHAMAMAHGSMVSGDNRGQVRIWSVPRLERHTIATSPSQSQSGVLAVSPNRGSVAFAGDQGTIRIVDLADHRDRTLVGHQRVVTGVTFVSPDQLISVAADGQLRRWDLANDRSHLLHQHDGAIIKHVVSPGGGHIAFRGPTDIIQLLSVADQKVTRFGDLEAGFAGMAFSHRGDRFVTSSVETGDIHVIDLATGETRLLSGQRLAPEYLTFSPDDTRVAACDLGSVAALWSLATGARTEFAEPCRQTAFPVFSPDGSRLAIVAVDHTLHLHDLTSGGETLLAGHEQRVRQVVFTGSGNYVLSAGGDGVFVWDLERRSSHVLSDGTQIRRVELALGDTAAITIGGEGKIRRWQHPLSDEVPRQGPALGGWLSATTSATRSPERSAPSAN